MQINNIKNEIQHFLKEFCIQAMDEIEPESYTELMMDDHKCIEYEGHLWYIPGNCSLMDENDELLQQMLLATFNYEL